MDEKILVWIYFDDKGINLNRYFSTPKTVVSERSLKRRAKVKYSGKLIDYSDIPISHQYILGLRKLGINIKQKSKWLNAVSCYVTKSELNLIKNLQSIKMISEVKTFKREKTPLPVEVNKFESTNSSISTVNSHTYDYGQSILQNNLINTTAVHDQGYSGKGILICLMDSGFDQLSHEAFNSMNIIAAWDFVNNDPDVEDGTGLGTGSHGTSTLSLIGGLKQGQIIGTAFGADYILAKTENTVSETHVEEDNWIAASEWADSIGADVFSTSLGYLTFDDGGSYTASDMDGNTAVITIAADLAVKKGIIVFNSAGNNGNQTAQNTLNAPADGDSVIAIGAVDLNKNRASFSSYGPTANGRIKPDFMAMGVNTYAARNISDQSYSSSFSGTSASCPLAAGVAALMLEKDYSLTPIEIREILRTTSDNSSSPDNLYGWGVINALAAMDEIPSVSVQLKIYLEGSYNTLTQDMNIGLGSNIPLTSPYVENLRTIDSIPVNIVDWVLIELKETLSGPTVTSRSALLHRDGRIVADDGVTNNILLDAQDGYYFITVKHRNHLPIMSLQTVNLTTN